MKILYIGDTHYSSHHMFSQPVSSFLSERGTNHIATAKLFCTLIDQHTPDVVIHGGDAFHTQGSLSTEDVYIASVCLSLISEHCSSRRIPFNIIVGNHDLFSDNSERIHSIKFVGSFPNTTLVESPTVMDGLLYFPYTRSMDLLKRSLDTLQASVLISHLDYRGARFNSKMVDTHGFQPSLFSHYDTVINGHYHLPHEVNRRGRSPIIMAGAPEYWSFSDPVGTIPRGFLLYEDGTITRIPNTASPLWLTFTSADLSSLESIRDYEVKPYLKLKVFFESELEQYRTFLSEYTHTIEILVERKNSDTSSFRSSSSMDSRETLSNFVNSIDTELDRESLIEVGCGYL